MLIYNHREIKGEKLWTKLLKEMEKSLSLI